MLWISEWPREDVPPDFLHSIIFALRGPPFHAQPLSAARCPPMSPGVASVPGSDTQALADRHQKQRVGQIADLADDQEYQDLLDREQAINRGHTDIEFVGLIAVTGPTLTDLAGGPGGDRASRRQRRLRRPGVDRAADGQFPRRRITARPLPRRRGASGDDYTRQAHPGCGWTTSRPVLKGHAK